MKQSWMWVLLALLMLPLFGLVGWYGWQKKNIAPQSLRLAISPWPGFTYLQLAQEKGFFRNQGLSLTLVEMGSVADVQEAYERGQVDGFAGFPTIAMESQIYGNRATRLLMVVDESQGAHQIIAHPAIQTMSQLQGKRVGVENTPLGRYILQRALSLHQMGFENVKLVPLDQVAMAEAFQRGEIDAAVTYPPFSHDIQQAVPTHVVFASHELPQEIFNVVGFATDVVENNPLLGQKLRKAFDEAITYAQNHPEEFESFVQKKENIPLAVALAGIRVLNTSGQRQLLEKEVLIATWQRLLPYAVADADRSRVAPFGSVMLKRDWAHE